MSEPEAFVSRWSRLKRQAGKAAEEEAPGKPAEPAAGGAPAEAEETAKSRTAAEAAGISPAFDPASLPAIESITAGTDIRAFFQSGVPTELTRAALRRVWTTDPAIRDFIGIAENQWDFTEPGAIPGFGPLEATDDVRKLVAQAMGRLGETADQLAGATGDPPSPAVQRSTTPAERCEPTSGIQEPGMPDQITETDNQQSRVDVAVRDDAKPAKTSCSSNRRGHGSALPQ